MKTEITTVRTSFSKAGTFLIKGLFVALILFAQQSLSAQDSKRELRAKEKISKLIQEVKAIEDVSKKEKALEKAVTKFDKRLQRLKKQDITTEQVRQVDELSSSLNDAFAQAKGNGHQELNAFADFFESEANQAVSEYGAILMYVGIILALIIVLSLALGGL